MLFSSNVNEQDDECTIITLLPRYPTVVAQKRLRVFLAEMEDSHLCDLHKKDLILTDPCFKYRETKRHHVNMLARSKFKLT